MLTAIVAVIGAVGWGLWWLSRRDARDARLEAKDANEMARIADSRSSAVSEARAVARDALHAAECEARVTKIRLGSLRNALDRAEAERDALILRVGELQADRSGVPDRTSERLRLAGTGRIVRNREDD
jgi:hypothetical protein